MQTTGGIPKARTGPIAEAIVSPPAMHTADLRALERAWSFACGAVQELNAEIVARPNEPARFLRDQAREIASQIGKLIDAEEMRRAELT